LQQNCGAEAKAPDAKVPPPVKLIVGADVYPLPAEVIVTDVTAPFETVAVPEAPLPCPPENCTVGALV
jgi:hypothetical protein